MLSPAMGDVLLYGCVRGVCVVMCAWGVRVKACIRLVTGGKRHMAVVFASERAPISMVACVRACACICQLCSGKTGP
jgi:hypothetical protein